MRAEKHFIADGARGSSVGMEMLALLKLEINIGLGERKYIRSLSSSLLLPRQ